MSSRALILGCAGRSLTPEEAAFFRDVRPWGFILFKRNIGTPDEVRALTCSLRDCVGRADAPILIDQEGGRVQRMGPPHWPAYPAGRAYARFDGAAAAIARLGAKQDGVLRNHKRHADGTPRDTVIFSIIDAEWQGVKRHLQYRLDSHA